MSNVKDSALPVSATLDNSDKLRALVSGVSKTILFSTLKTLIGAQPSNSNLTTYAGIAPTTIGQNVLALVSPTSPSYYSINNLGVFTAKTPAQLVADLLANGGGVDRTTAQTLIGPKKINGITLSAATAAGPDSSTTDIPEPSDTFPLTVVKVGGWTGGFFKMRLVAATDVTFPKTGTLATIGGVPQPASADTKASATSVDLTSVKGSQVDITGTVEIDTIVLDIGSEKLLRFTGILTLKNSATLICPTGRDIVTEANGYAVVVGGSGGVVTIKSYVTSDKGNVNIDGDVKITGDVYINGGIGIDGLVSMNGNFQTSGPVNLTASVGTTLRPATGTSVDVLLPASGTIQREVGNYSTVAQSIAAATRTYIDGSGIWLFGIGKVKVGTKFCWKFNMTKTAAGSAASTIDIAVGTSGTTADTAICSFTKPAGTAAADEGFVEINAIIRGPLSGAGIMVAELTMMHNLAATGHMTIPIACVNSVSSGFDVTVSALFFGICLTSGASDAITIQQVSAQADNI